MEQTLHLQRRIAVVGATSGIGRAAAELLRARGHAVLAIGRDPAKLDALARAADSAAAAGSLVVGRADGADGDAVRALLHTHAPIDDLVIAASGGKGAGPFAGLALDELRAGFEQKFWVHLTTLQAALDGLAPDASITLITAISARTAAPGTSGLAAINGALETMVPILARELAPRRVNAISPGIIDTPWWAGVPEPARGEIFAAYAASTPLGRVGEAHEVAHAIAFVVENRYVTGSVLEVAGGYQMV
jgi:NAD(P)-dependent dehydrogenase (short-subunit alcohol dehydrogenase family)